MTCPSNTKIFIAILSIGHILSQNCDFEIPCNWTNSNNDKFDWTRKSGSTGSTGTGPTSDHTSLVKALPVKTTRGNANGANCVFPFTYRNRKYSQCLSFRGRKWCATVPNYDESATWGYCLPTGYYMYIETSSPRRKGDNAVYMSPSITKGPKCLKFWYHMFGPHIGALSIYSAVNGNMTKLWTKSGTQGNKWKSANVTVGGASAFQVAIEGIRGVNYKGDISIDDLQIADGSCDTGKAGNSTGYGKCTFETDMCGFKDTRGSFQWIRHKGATASVGTGPTVDHTLGTKLGYYMYVEASSTRANTKGGFTETYTGLDSKGSCLTFWYHMFGAHTGFLKVYVNPPAAGTKIPQFAVDGQQGNLWIKGEIIINTTSAVVVFEGTARYGYQGDMALDDISVLRGKCPKPGECDFQNGWCTWYNLPNSLRQDNFDWIRGKGQTQSRFTGPQADHNGDLTGYYAYLESSSPAKPGQNTILSSELFNSTGSGHCFLFFYHMYGNDIGSLNVYVNTSTGKELVWTQKGNKGKAWKNGQVDVERPGSYKVLVEGVIGTGYRGDIAIDDFKFKSGKCPTVPSDASPKNPITTSAPTTTMRPTVPSNQIFNCDFEFGICTNWKQDKTTDTLDWTLARGATSSQGTGPSTDHTKGTKFGRYVYLEASSRKPNDTARLISTDIPATGDTGGKCLTFWYHMYGPHVNTLNIYVLIGGHTGKPLWSRTGTQGNKWIKGQVTLIGRQPFKAVIEATRGLSYLGDIAVDDISLTTTKCIQPSSICTFENNQCGYIDDTSSDVQFQWKRQSLATSSAGTGPKADHTLQSSSGFYMYTEATSRKPGDKARIMSPVNPSTTGSCLQFWYHMYGYDMGTLSVYLKINNKLQSSPLWSEFGDKGNQWKTATATIKSGYSYQIVFQGTIGSGYRSDMAIDDVRLTNGACQAPGFCDFENGLCTYSNSKLDDFDWLVGSGKTQSRFTGPNFDHTFGNANGSYIFLEVSSPVKRGDVAILKSQQFNSVGGKTRCLNFWYHMYGADIGTLQVIYKVFSGSQTEKVIWNLTGQQQISESDPWKYARVPVDMNSDHMVTFKGIAGGGYRGDIAVDDVQFTTLSCVLEPPEADPNGKPTTQPPTTYPRTRPTTQAPSTLSCNFEKDFCSLRQDSAGTFNWTRTQGYTGSRGTGPSTDHTFGKGAVAKYGPGSIRHAGGKCIHVLNGAHTKPKDETQLVLHDGCGQNRLEFVFANGLIKLTKYNMCVKLKGGSTSSGAKVVISDTCTNNWLMLDNGAIQDASTKLCISPYRGTAYPPNNSPLVVYKTCTKKTRYFTFTPTMGFYAYIETSLPRKANDTARLISPAISTSQCLNFWYHMYGSHVNKLNVYVKTPRASYGVPAWSKYGSHGNSWKAAHVYMNATGPYVYVFEAIRGNGYKGDIAIDDVSVSVNCPPPLECSFEETNPVMCGWKNVKGGKDDDFDWSLGQGATSSVKTGPAKDHTYNDDKGKYIFIETSGRIKANSKARLMSPHYPGNARTRGQCFQFWYHMYGASIGKLNLYLQKQGNVLGLPVWGKTGNQGNRWSIGQITISSQSQFKLIFEAIRGTSYTGDIALDDFKMLDGPCNRMATCDFENEKCTYKNTIESDTFDWLIGQGTTTSKWTGPLNDHSLKNGNGHYIFVDASQQKQGDVARLYSESINRHRISFIPYCLRFWYHMKGSNIGTLKIILKTGPGKTLETTIWSLAGNQGYSWKQGTIPMYSTSDYIIVFEATIGNGGRGDIALDDIVYSMGRCGITPDNANPKYVSTTVAPTAPPTTPMPTVYDCNFEKKDICQWQQAVNDQFNWTLNSGATGTIDSGPSFDHTTGNKTGTYIYIETSWPRKNGDAARIISPPMDSDKDHGHPHCLKFWFHMYGPHVDTLNVYKKYGGTLQKIWTRVGDNGDYWKAAQVDLTSNYKYQVVIEGIRGVDYKGDISIDDIEIADHACPAPSFCDFEHGLCGFENDPTADFNWDKNKGETASTGTGPPFDHTLQTNQGYYMYTEASGRRKNGDKARLVGPVIQHDQPVCMEFWFHMLGFHVGQLNVYVKTPNGGNSLIWRRSGNHSMQWKIARVNIRPRSGRQIVFEGVRGLSYSGDIAIDDVKMIKGYCAPAGDCSFEKGMCSWSNVKRSNLDQFDWITGSGSSNRFKGPSVDHTSGTNTGKYVFIEADIKNVGYKAWLISEDFYPTLGRCLQFWTQMSGVTGILNVYINGQNGTMTKIWTLAGDQGNKWINGHAPISSREDYQIVFEVVRETSTYGHIALDDIVFTNFRCANLPPNSKPKDLATPPPATTTQAPTPAPNDYSCNFTFDYCNWFNDSTAHFNWTRHQGSTGSASTGPSGDHNTGRSGWYIFIETSWPRKVNDTARLVSQSVPATSQMCFQFWYHMYGDHIGNLTVYKKAGSTMTTLWKKTGTQGPRWRHATIDLSAASTFKIVLEGSRGAGYMGDIALDDLFLNTGTCPPSGECTFEDPRLCGWENIVGDNFDWKRDNAGTSSSGTGPRFDHTYGTAQGFYMYIEASSPRSKGHKAWLKSGTYEPTLGRCLSFWYHMYGQHVGELNVLLLQNGSRSAPIWQLKGQQGNIWKPSKVTIKSPVKHNIIFEGRTGVSYRGDIAIDDVVITEGPCPDYGNCDFERDKCGYTNKPVIDQFDWLLGNGATSSTTTGPTSDHTTKTALGQYLFIESSWPRQIHETAIIGSETIPVKGTGKCVQFWYHMYGDHIGSLEVNMRVGNDISETIVWKLEGNQKNIWRQGQAPFLSRKQNMEIRFEGIRGSGYKGDIAIDDITVVDYDGTCPVIPSTAVPWGCNFELGFCKWQQLKTDDFDWRLHKGLTGSVGTGPKYDHTTNTTGGYYAYIETSFPRKRNDTAALISPIISGNGTKTTYCMWFAYHMYGPHVDTLQVYTKSQGVNRPVIWQRKGSEGVNWHHAEVQVTVLYSTQVVIEGVRGVSYKGDIAIDDLDIWYGDCFTSGICTFEGADICYWYTPKSNRQLYWQRAAGSTPSVKTGPMRDHTYGTPYGHYMYIETSTAPPNANAYMYSPWYYNMGQKCVQFFYHMYGQQIGQLNVYIRYANSRYLYRMFSKSGNQNNTWHMGQASVVRSKTYFQIVVRGTKGDGYQGDIAVDDFRIRDGSCPAPGDCDFEHIDFCSWMQESSDTFDWIIGSGGTQSYFTGPKTDHTTQSAGGYYAFIESSNPRQPGDKALIKSIEFSPTTGKGTCFSFWYHMYGSSIGKLNVYLRKTSVGKTLSNDIMWSLSGNQGDKWLQGRFTLQVKTTYQVVIEAARGYSYTGDIAVDDIEFTSGACSFFPTNAWPAGRSTPAPTATVMTIGPTTGNTGFDCNFDNGLCKTWVTNSSRAKFNWRLHQGSTGSVGTGPHNDHTTNSDKGKYVYIETSYPAQPNDTAWLTASNIPNTNGFCMSFWYHMYGPHVGSLNLYVTTKTLTVLRFTRNGTQGDEWKHGQIYVKRDVGSPISIRFEGIRGSSYMGDIALDDISIKIRNDCPAEKECTFEQAMWAGGSGQMCGWTQDKQKDQFDWSIGSGGTPSVKTGPKFDHTLKTKQGHYAYIETSSPRKFGQTAIIISGSHQATQGQCFSFWYHMYGSTIGNLTLFQRVDNVDSPLWSKTKAEGNKWWPALVTVRSASKPFQLLFQGTVGKSYTGDIAIDDLILRDGRCPRPGDCDFEDLISCTYTQETVEDDFDWMRGHGGTNSWRTGPTFDNTKKDDTGHYYFIEASAPRTKGDKARLVSELFDPTSSRNGRCLQFYRHMYGTAVGTLNVYVKTGPGNGSDVEQLVWTNAGNQGNSWIQGQAPVYSSKPFRLIFEAVRGNGYKGDIALDDINFNNNFYPCTYIPSNAAPPTLPPTTITPSDSNCTFDQGLCRWKQVQGDDDFDWTLRSGNTGSYGTGPLGDHTSGKGKYIYIEASFKKPNQSAILRSPPIRPTLGAVCFKFAYHMHGAHVNALYIYKLANGRRTRLWKRIGTQGNKWRMGQVNIRGVTGIFNIEVKALRGTSYQGDISLDDFVVSNGACAPPKYCDFENNQCGWYNIGRGDKFNWKRSNGGTSSNGTGPSTDHTTGVALGSYMYIEASAPRRYKDNALLYSIYYPGSSKGNCFNFWYHMYGAHIGALSVYLNTGKSTPIWNKTDDQGNVWRHGRVTVRSRSRFRLIIEGVIGKSFLGDIAIDDIWLDDYPCPAPGACDFESQSFCTWNQVPNKFNTSGYDDFDWVLGSGSTPSYGTGPTVDHTKGTALGTYAFIEVSGSIKVGQKAQLVSEKFAATKGKCMSFWYHMYGYGVGDLNLYIRDSSMRQPHLVKSISGQQGNRWIQGEIGLHSQKDFHVIIEAVKGKSYSGDISIDDILIVDGNCVGLCSSVKPAARVACGAQSVSAATCVVSYGCCYDNSVPNVPYCFQHPSSCKAVPIIARQRCGYKGISQTYCTRRGCCYDDTASGGPTCYFSLFTPTDFPTTLTPVTTPPPSPFDCNFEKNQCNYRNLRNDQFNWKRHQGSTSSWGTGPQFDHTLKDAAGYYMYVETSYNAANDTANLATPNIDFPTGGDNICVRFWYHMYGQHVGEFKIFHKLTTNVPAKPLWKRTGSIINKWVYAQILIPRRPAFSLVFQGVRGQGYQGDIAIDDVSFVNGACPPTLECEFENNDTCGWTQDASDQFDWKIGYGNTTSWATGPKADHTYETGFGHYLFIEGSYPRRPGDKARIESFSHPPTKGKCLEFFYHMKGTGIGTLNVWLRRGQKIDPTPMWTLSGNQGDEWFRATATVIENTQNWKVIIEAIRGGDYNSDIAIDDISFREGACTPLGDCDFENDDASACGYENYPSNKVDWLIYSGATPSYNTGPVNDHTLGTKEGHYLYMESSSPAKKGDAGAFMSEKFKVNPNYKWCVDFYYHMYGDGVGSLAVKIRYMSRYSRGRYFYQTVFKEDGNHDNIWLHGQANITSSYDFQIMFVGTVGSGMTHRSDIAIDDIIVRQGLCKPPAPPSKPDPCARKCKDGTCISSDKVCDFFVDCAAQTSDNTDTTDEDNCDGCDFEKGYCLWNDTSSGNFDWNRISGGTASVNTGPSTDHTKQNALGYYIYVEASQGKTSDLATLAGPILKQASATCTLTFWYHMYGTSIGDLNVYLVNGYRLTLLWTLSGNQGNQWKQGTVYINRQTKPYSVRFIAERSYSHRGDIALDDLKFENCALPSRARYCSTRYSFRCAVTGACLPLSRLCDYTDDCGDGSDEQNCRWTQYPYRCNFEYSLCYWRNLKDDQFDFTRTKGSTDSVGTGPLFDHTTGTGSGYYIYAEASWPRRSGDKARIGSGYLDAVSRGYCLMRFYYHLYGDHIGSLSVKMRTCKTCPGSVLWHRNNTAGNYWVRHAIYLRSLKPFQVIFEAEIGNGYQGDIAIDDVSFDGCSPYWGKFPDTLPTTIPPTTTSACSFGQFYCSKDSKCILSEQKCDFYKDCSDGQDEMHCGPCDFEKDMCGYKDISTGKFEFQRSQPLKDSMKNGPSVDHTLMTSKGYFAIIRNGTGSRSTYSYLLSPQLSATAPSCKMQVFYYGSKNSNWLRVSHKQSDGNGKSILSRLLSTRITNMDKWQNVTIGLGQRPQGWQLMFAMQTGYAAIDDIKFMDCAFPRKIGACNRLQTRCDNGACINPEKMCDFSNHCGDGSDEKQAICKNFEERCNFETDTCNWYQDQSDDFDWIRKKGRTSSGGTGAEVDHTTGTSQGYHMYIETSSPRKPNDTARLLSTVFKPSKQSCIMRFFYHMYGKHVDMLAVKMKFSQDPKSPMKTVWKKTGNQGNLWNFAKLLLRSDKNYQLVIEARRGDGFRGDISIDDISFTSGCVPDYKATLSPNPITPSPPPGCKAGEFRCGDGQCIDASSFCNFRQDCKNNADEIRCPATCDFEGGTSCNWFNSIFGDIMDWTVHQGKTPSNGTGPPFDHTKGTKDGWYAYMEANQRKGSNFPNAHFVSPMYYQGAYDCKFSFWYNMYHYKISVKNDAKLNLLYRRNGKDTKLWTMARTTGNKWVQATVQLPRCPQDFRLIFEGHHYWGTKTDAAIDDLKFSCAEPKPPTSCASGQFQCLKTKQCINDDMKCDMDRNCCDGSDESNSLCKGYTKLDFETGLQKWIQLDTDDFNFDIQSGKTSSSGTGPQTDHTLQEEHGKYIYTEASIRQENETALLGSPTIAATQTNYYAGSSCRVRFWYHMYGKHIGTLTVYTATQYGVPEKQVWQLSGDQGNTWKRGEADLTKSKDFQVIFEAKMGTSYKGDISIDDISLTPGCVLNNALLPGQPTPPPVDPCLPNFQCKQTGACISRAMVCDFSVDCPGGTDEDNVTCGYPQGFENGFGAWKNALYEAYDFNLHQGPTSSAFTGPSADARGDKKGYYAYLETSKRQRNLFATLYSPMYAGSFAQCDIVFWYHMYGRNVGVLRLDLVNFYPAVDTPQYTTLFELRGNQGNKWVKTRVSIGRRYEPFFLNFTATVGGGVRGDIAIDEISFENCGHPPLCTGNDPGKFICDNSRCINAAEMCNFIDDCGDTSDEDVGGTCNDYLGCNFEVDVDPCNFTQDKTGDDFDWKLNSGWTPSYNTGPTRDHTYGTSQGHYMYIEASGRKVGDKARLLSLPIESRQGGNCTLRFHYHMAGKHVKDLNVYVLQNDKLNLINSATGDYGDVWREDIVDLSTQKGVYRLVFEGIVGASFTSDIAIDDIILSPDCLTNSSRVFPTRTPCSEQKFVCTSIYQCLPNNTRCNGVQDCRDGSDEAGCTGPNTGKSVGGETKSSVYASGIVGGLVVLLIVVLVVYIIVKRKREKKLQLFSVFYDPTKQPEDEKKGKKEVAINEGVSNPVYDEKPMGDFAMGDLDTDMFTDDTFAVPAETKGGATSMANPLYQDPYMEDDDSPLSNF